MLKVYVMVSFWIGVLGFILRMCALVGTEFPKVKTKTLGEHLFELILGILYCEWAGIALWGAE